MKTNHIDISRRFGKFEIKRQHIDETPSQIFQVLKKFLVVRAESIFASNTIEYTALSPLFELVADGSVVPSYELVCTYFDSELVDLEVALI